MGQPVSPEDNVDKPHIQTRANAQRVEEYSDPCTSLQKHVDTRYVHIHRYTFIHPRMNAQHICLTRTREQVVKTWGTAMNESVLRVLKKQFLRSE